MFFFYTLIIGNILFNLGYFSCGVLCLDSYTSSHFISLIFLLSMIAIFSLMMIFEKIRIYLNERKKIWTVLFIIANVEIFGMIVYDIALILLGVIDGLVFMYEIILIIFGGTYFCIGMIANKLIMKVVNLPKKSFVNFNQKGEVLGASFKETIPEQDINVLYPGLDRPEYT